jgi:tetratricopeptide (TPR) repeat protein
MPGNKLFVLPLLLALSCAHGGRPGRVVRIEMEPLKLQAVRDGAGARVEAFDAATLFEQADRDLKAQRRAQAAAAYDRLVAEFPDSRYLVPALYNAGLAYEGLKRYADAAARYERVAGLRPDGKDGLDALFRLGACYAEVQRWPDSLEVFGRVLARRDLSLADRIEAMTRRGLAQFELDQLQDAERTFRAALDHFRQHEADERLESDFFLAMAQFYLAHVQHRHFRALPVRLPQRQLEQDLEAKARVFLVAQSRYIDTVKLRHPVWATAAGYQIGALYREMYDVLINAPQPPELDTEEKRQVYTDVLKGRLRSLLLRARRIHEKNVAMAERIGVDNDWVRRSNEQLAEMERLLDEATPGEKEKGRAQREAPETRPPPTPDRRAPDFRPRTVM